MEKVNQPEKRDTEWDNMSQVEKEKIISDAPKWWNGLNENLKASFSQMAYKKPSMELTASQVQGLFRLAKDHTTTLPIDVKHFEEYTDYMTENGWWSNEGPFNENSLQGVRELMKDPNSKNVIKKD